MSFSQKTCSYIGDDGRDDDERGGLVRRRRRSAPPETGSRGYSQCSSQGNLEQNQLRTFFFGKDILGD